MLAFWFQDRSTSDSVSLLTMIMNPDRVKNIRDMMSKLDSWDALIRFAMAPEAVVENRLAGRRGLDNCAKVRCITDDMIRDKREARGATKLRGGGHQPPQDVDQLKFTPRGYAPVKGGLTTWKRTRPKEKTPRKTAAGPKRTRPAGASVAVILV